MSMARGSSLAWLLVVEATGASDFVWPSCLAIFSLAFPFVVVRGFSEPFDRLSRRSHAWRARPWPGGLVEAVPST